MTQGQTRNTALSLGALIVANALPVAGFLFWGWTIGDVLLTYWLENLVIGWYTVGRLMLSEGPTALKLFLVPFFCIHFGGFTMIHGLFLFGILQYGDASVLNRVGNAAELGALALFISHGVSFVQNDLLRKTPRPNVLQAMFAPYARVMTMHLVIIVGAVPIVLYGKDSVALSIGLVVLKTMLDAHAHGRNNKMIEAMGKWTPPMPPTPTS